jgi:hypothetical protein
VHSQLLSDAIARQVLLLRPETFVESGGAAAKELSHASEKQSFSAHRTAKP